MRSLCASCSALKTKMRSFKTYLLFAMQHRTCRMQNHKDKLLRKWSIESKIRMKDNCIQMMEVFQIDE